MILKQVGSLPGENRLHLSLRAKLKNCSATCLGIFIFPKISLCKQMGLKIGVSMPIA